MRGGTFVHRFGPFEFDPASGRLFRSSTRIPLSASQSAILRRLIEQAGHVLPKVALLEAGWGNVAVSENSLKQSISRLRKTLGTAHDGTDYIETNPNQGYRFAGALERGERHDEGAPPDIDLAPYQAFVQGRADLYTLRREFVNRALAAFERALQLKPDYAPAHIGVANAGALAFEASRMDAGCDLEPLRRALGHARRGTTLAPASGEAWSTLAFVQGLYGEIEAAAAAAGRAFELEPSDWLHSLRLAYISWGEDRIRAARAVLRLCPGLALAHWLVATVLIARGMFDAALAVLADGCCEQDAQSPGTDRFTAVGLHLLRGLVFAAQGRLDEAVREFESELSFDHGGHLYAKDCAANTWYALGAVRLRQRRHDEADSAFRKALNVAAVHFCAAAALGRPLPMPSPDDPRRVDALLARAIGLVRSGRHSDAAHAYREAITDAPLSAGWILPVEPLINATAYPDAWREALTMIRRRAV